MPCYTYTDPDTGSTYERCQETTTSTDTGLATVWIVTLVVVILIKATFWITVCYCYQKRRQRRMYLVAQGQVRVAQCRVNTQQGHPQAPVVIPVAQPVDGSGTKAQNGLAMHMVEPPSYEQATVGNAQQDATAGYVPEPAMAVAQQQPIEDDRAGLLAE